MKREYVRRVTVFENHFRDFKRTIDKDVLKKLYQIFTLIMTVNVVPTKFLKAIRGRRGLYEIRLDYEGNIYRVFCCFDEGNLVVLFNGFQKKSWKIPVEQLDIAEALMKKYYKLKKDLKHE